MKKIIVLTALSLVLTACGSHRHSMGDNISASGGMQTFPNVNASEVAVPINERPSVEGIIPMKSYEEDTANYKIDLIQD